MPAGAISPRSRRNSQIPPIRSKFLPPAPSPGAVPRPRLLEKLTSSRDRALTLVCAPAGYGKTTLLSQWIAEAVAADSAWVTLDAGDADPARFWAYLVSALSKIAPPAGRRSLLVLGRGPSGCGPTSFRS